MLDYSHPLGITFKKSRWITSSLDTISEILELSNLTHLTRLSIPDQEFNWPASDWWMRLTTLTNLKSFDIKEKKNTPNKVLLQYFPNIVSVNAQNIESIAATFYLTNLQHLQFNIEPGQKFITMLPELTNPGKLTSLVINGFNTQPITLTDDMVTCLTGLKRLTLHSHTLEFPHHLLPNLERLEVINLSDHIELNSNLTQLKFVHPAQTIIGLTNLTKLKSLSIHYEYTTTPKPMEFLTTMMDLCELHYLAPNHKFSVDMFCPYFTYPKLTELVIHGKDIIITDQISKLTSLQKISIRGNADLDLLAKLTTLTSFKSISGHVFREKDLSPLTKLKRLDINCKNGVDFDQILNLMDLTNLEELTLRMKVKSITIQGLELLTRLKSLVLIVNVEIGSNFLQKLTGLTSLFVNAEKMFGFWSTISTFTALKELRIMDSLADDSQALMLKSLTQLTRLDLPEHLLLRETKHQFTHIYQLK